jgi:hypothetical protein
MDADLHTLTYFSRNSIEAADGDLEVEINRILAIARESNRKLGVTGALLFSEGCFAQVLEGGLAQVEAIFERIECDPRHQNVTILQFTPIKERSFGNWSMAFAGLSPAGVENLHINGLLQNPDRIKSGDAGRDLITVLHNLMGRYDADIAAG